jgi:ankyrin repeat protein
LRNNKGLSFLVISSVSVALNAGSGLIKASAGGDLAMIRAALAAGENVNEADSSGWTALMWAIYNRQLTAAEILLEQGADPNRQSTDSRKSYSKGTTALMIAAYDCQDRQVLALLRKGAQKELVDASGLNAEAFARKSECQGVLETLGFRGPVDKVFNAKIKGIESGMPINAADENGWTALMWAMYHQDAAIAKTLLDLGADPNIQSTGSAPWSPEGGIAPAGTTALMIATRSNALELASLLVRKGANWKMKNAVGSSAESYAIEGDAWDLQDLFLDRSPLQKTYTKLVIEAFTAGKEATRAQAFQCQEQTLAALNEMNGFGQVELAVAGKPYFSSVLMLKVGVQKYKVPAIGSPRAVLSLRLIDAGTGQAEREQLISLTTGNSTYGWSNPEETFLKGLGSVIAEYTTLAAGKAPPYEPSAAVLSAPRIVMNGRATPRTGRWQWINRHAEDPMVREEGFEFSMLQSKRIAVWPITQAELDSAVTTYAKRGYGSTDKVLAEFARKLSEKWLSFSEIPGLSASMVTSSLAGTELEPWLASRRILPFAQSHLLSINQLGVGFERIKGHACLKGTRYLVVPHGLRIFQHEGGQQGASLCKVQTSLGIALIDLEKERVVWNRTFLAVVDCNYQRWQVFEKAEDILLDTMETGLRYGK